MNISKSQFEYYLKWLPISGGKKFFLTKKLSRNNYTDASCCCLPYQWSFTYNWRRIFYNKAYMNQRLHWFELKSSFIHWHFSFLTILLPAEHSTRSVSHMAGWFIVLITLCVFPGPRRCVHNDLLSKIFDRSPAAVWVQEVRWPHTHTDKMRLRMGRVSQGPGLHPPSC